MPRNKQQLQLDLANNHFEIHVCKRLQDLSHSCHLVNLTFKNSDLEKEVNF